MEGVTILNTITEEIHAGGFGSLCVLGIFLIIIGLISLWIEFSSAGTDGALLFIAIISIFFGLTCTAANYPNYGPVVDYNYSYEVTVEDGVDFNAFNEKYEIIKQRGSIYTVVEKDTN